MSAFSLDPEKLREGGVDLVISTVPLEIDFPHVCVSPIPQKQDMMVIDRALETVSASRTKEIRPKPGVLEPESGLSLKDIESLSD